MPVSHSSFVSWSGPVSCGCALLPLKTRVKGPAAPLPAEQQDIIDESLTSFRANVLYRNFAPSSPADLTLCYLTVLIGETLRACSRCRTRDEARKQLTQLSMSTQFAIPGERSFPLPGFFPAPASKAEGEAWRAYFRQAREETVNRVIELAYSPQPVIAAAATGGAGTGAAAAPATAAATSSSSDAPQNKCQRQRRSRQRQPACLLLLRSRHRLSASLTLGLSLLLCPLSFDAGWMSFAKRKFLIICDHTASRCGCRLSALC